MINCLEDALDRLFLLTYIPGTPDDELVERFSGAGAVQLKGLLQNLFQLEEGHAVLMRSRHSNPFQAKPSRSASSDEMLEQLHHVIRNVCRQLKRTQGSDQILRSGPDERSEYFVNFHGFLSDLTLVMFRKLSTTVEEEAASANQLTELTERERSAEDEREALNQTLRMQRAERERELSLMEQQSSKLKQELHDIQQSNQLEIDSIRAEMKETMEIAGAEHEGKIKRQQDTVDQQNQTMVRTSETHRETEASLRKKKEKKEADLKAVMEKYDSEMFKLDKETEELKQTMDEEKAQLMELEEYFAKIDANKQKADEEDRIISEFKHRMQAAMDVLHTAATNITKVERGRSCRRELAKSKKGGKKGKKKGKKK